MHGHSEGSAIRRERLDGLDAVKGLCIALVVLIHAAPADAEAWSTHVVGGVARLAVPVFLGVTGFLAGWKAMDRARFARSVWTFARLHFLYGAFYGVLLALVVGLPEPVGIRFLLLRFGEAAYPGQYYFVVLIQTFALAALLARGRAWRTPAGVAVAAAGAVIGCAALFAARALEADAGGARIAWRLASTPNWVWLWFVYFALGVVLGERARRGPASSPRVGVALAAAGVAVGAIAVPAIPPWPEPSHPPYAQLHVFAGSLLVVAALPALATARAPRWLLRLGRDSFGVFVLNPALLLALERAFGAPTSIPDSLARTAAAIVAAVGGTAVLRRVAPWSLP
ncbi:MAG: acyltransferase family protein [Myxococcota bacterium]